LCRVVEDDHQFAFPGLRLLAEPHRQDAASGRALGQAPPGQRSKKLRGCGQLDIGAAQGRLGGSERSAEDDDAPACVPDSGEENGSRVGASPYHIQTDGMGFGPCPRRIRLVRTRTDPCRVAPGRLEP
jgi:hypothetical protein